MAYSIMERMEGESPEAIMATTITSYCLSSILTGLIFLALGGFKLGTLNRLVNVKDDKNQRTFMDYIEMTVRKKYPELESFVDELSGNAAPKKVKKAAAPRSRASKKEKKELK